MATIISTNVAQSLLMPGDYLLLTQTGSITTAGASAIASPFGGVRMTLAGLVWSDQTAIQTVVVDALSGQSSYTVTTSGQVIGDQVAMRLQGPSVVKNYGQILGEAAVQIWTSDVQDTNVALTNIGRIDGGYAAITALGANTGGFLNVTNRGTISASGWGVLDQTVGMTWVIHNYGRMEGGIWLGGSNDVVGNKGTILGDIYLGEGQDEIDTRGGTMTGLIWLGGGDDFAVLGAAAEFVQGDGGFDLVSYEYSQVRVILNLANGLANRGDAAGDQFAGVEAFAGSDVGADRMTGDAADNRLEGRGGNDTLVGGLGADTLVGGQGLDLLTGNAGADWFVFGTPDGNVDRITDFARGVTPDRIVVQAFDFGIFDLAPGAVAAGAFILRADNQAQQADDRFIFDTTTSTLWADFDGNGAEVAIAVCQVQAGVVLRAADLWLI
ncbi:calcium-binding protein [Stagnihabitans tardus]|uniref:Calcium-binding protein n=1 Tax=Stagnihabitans tardus TaxID=2699202 RepID=A0AAE4YDR5_9RHOB|nr:hypothetical protein [Stagnihabitans tardus]NBZ89453.1 hypothetical protein [Stagnihabitans tardus]